MTNSKFVALITDPLITVNLVAMETDVIKELQNLLYKGENRDENV